LARNAAEAELIRALVQRQKEEGLDIEFLSGHHIMYWLPPFALPMGMLTRRRQRMLLPTLPSGRRQISGKGSVPEASA
jgi:hypothetical protein